MGSTAAGKPSHGQVPGNQAAPRIGRRMLFAGGVGAALTTAVPAQAVAATEVIEGPLSLRDPRVGCLLDGSDEAAKLNMAFTMLPAAGGELYLPAGVLGLGSEVTLPVNVSLTGANMGGSVICPSAGYTGRLLSTGGFNRISHLQFYGQRTSGVMLTIRKPRSMFSQLHFSNSGSHAIEFLGTSASSSAHANKLTDINIEDCVDTGILVNAWGYDNEFLNTWIGECRVGMRLQDGACFFNNLHVWGCQSHGIELRGNAHKNIFQNVYIESNGAGGTGNGIDAWQVNGNQFVGGRLWHNASNGIHVNASPRTRLTGLDIHENGADGIRGTDSLYCQVIGNQFYDLNSSPRQDHSITTVGTSNYWIVTNNVMRAADHASGAKSLAGANNVFANNIE